MTDWDVYLVTAEPRAGAPSTPSLVRAAIEGGVGVVQLRNKTQSVRERLATGREVRELTAEAGIPLIVNDRIDLAMALNADGIHLGDDDLPVAVARDLLGDDAIVGRSVSFVEDAREAVAAGADYLGVGAIYATDSKADIPEEEYAIGTERLAAIADAVDVPIVGIGGIDADNAADVVAAGADGVAVISAITAADDPLAATQALRAAVEQGRRRT